MIYFGNYALISLYRYCEKWKLIIEDRFSLQLRYEKMKKNTYIKLLITIIGLSGALWFGGSVVRSSIAFDIFETSDPSLSLKADYSEAEVMQSIYVYTNSSFYTMVGFGCLLFFGILFVINSRKDLKKMGWLVMAIILVFLATSVEAIMAYNDVLLIRAFDANRLLDIHNPIIQECFFRRVRVMTVPSGLSTLAMLTSFIYCIWRPLDKTKTTV